MLEIKNTEVFGLNRTIKASGSSFKAGAINTLELITDKDIKRAISLGSSQLPHQSHDSYLKGIVVQFDVKYPQYWTPEAQRYHFFEIIMSSSKMHKLTTLASKDFETFKSQFNKYVDDESIKLIQSYAIEYNKAQSEDNKYYYFMKMISNLPMGYELWMTITTNYLQLKTMFIQRKDHRLKEDWGAFCDWCLTLPQFSELTGCTKNKGE